jgi:two-component system, chemotaxis family, protein-glutamate methylesterase/glutaminase
MADRPIRVLVVDDSAFMRTVISQMLAGAPDIEVVGQAADGKTGLNMARDLAPDVITLDVEMPILSGLEMLRVLMAHNPLPVIMLSSLTQEGARVTIEALELGAVDYLPKDTEGGPLGMRRIAPVLIEKIRAVGGGATRAALRMGRRQGAVAPARPAPGRRSDAIGQGFPVVAIGSSTGGPTALCQLIPALPADLPAAVVLVQHMPPGFTRALAMRLDRLSGLSVAEAEDGAALAPGRVFVAPGGHHLTVRAEGAGLAVHVSDTPVMPMMPAVDVLFESLAGLCPERTIAVVLTGMGHDGLKGAQALSRGGAVVLAQAEDGCVVYGMPKAVAEAGLATRVVALSQMHAGIELAVGATPGEVPGVTGRRGAP